jgi:hypothetical protein
MAKKKQKARGMRSAEIRLACIEAAARHAPFKPEFVVALANDYYQFVIGQTDIKTIDLVSDSLRKISSDS